MRIYNELEKKSSFLFFVYVVLNFSFSLMKIKDLPHIFHLEFVMPIELHEETQSPQIANCFGLLGTSSTYYTRSCVFHHGIISGVQKLYAEFF